MLFTSHIFLFVFLPLVTVCCWQAEKRLGRSAAILTVIAGSLIFYYANSRAQISVLLASVAFNFALNRLWFVIDGARERRLITALLIVGNLACLAYYKYGTFILEQFGNVQREVTFEAIALPLGISFFTFQQIAYAADVHAGRVKEHRFLDYVFCVLFFPHLVAGPIVNYRELIPQLKLRRLFRFSSTQIAVGFSVLVIGLAKKTLLADNFAGFVTPAFADADGGKSVTLFSAWAGIVAYTFQIYFDFSGYSDMAIGLARIFGIQLPANFASPYKSASIIEFWRRWHITLSRFLRQYLYIPLGGNRGTSLARYRNLMITMLLGGIWHGAGWNFLLWGGVHGVMLIVNHKWRETTKMCAMRRDRRRIYNACACALTFVCTMLAWVLFRAQTFSGAAKIYAAMIGRGARSDFGGASWGAQDWRFIVLAAASFAIVFCLPNTQELFMRYRVSIRPEWAPPLERPFLCWRATFPWMVVMASLAGIACFYQPDFPQFLYWGF